MDQEIQFCTTAEGVRLAYAKVGQGPPLVKVANWLNHLEYDWQSPIWRPWFAGLARYHTLYRYDERGCGLSDWDVADFSFEAWVQDLETVIEATELERFPLFGMSQGGPIAIAYAAKYPERVSRLILYGTYTRGALLRNPSKQQLEQAKTLIKLIEVGWGQQNPAFRQVFTTLFLPEGTPEQIGWFNELQRISTSPENAAKIVSGFGRIDVREAAASLQVPTLVLHCQGDARCPFEEGRLTAAHIPAARFVPLESNNHVLLETEPAFQQFLDEVFHFLGTPDPAQNTTPPKTHPLTAVEKSYWNLTDREREVLVLMGQGFRNSEIAEKLVLSPKTVRNYVSNIFGKLQVSSRGEAIVLAREAGLVEN